MNNKFFSEIKGNLGFGCMRLPFVNSKVDIEYFIKMVDVFIENGFNYFDTAHLYLNGQSETAIREALTKRYPRESFVLADKLTSQCFETQEDIRNVFNDQLKACGVEYFDFYLMHAQDQNSYRKYCKCRAYETALELKKEGKIRHFGISFHDKANILERILSDYPDIEAVQIQFNYLDYDDASVESRKVYEVCKKFDKPVMVMEPVKGGSLANLTEKAGIIFDRIGSKSYASYALRFAGSFSQMCVILSGMSSLDQMNDNIDSMKDFRPLDNEEMNAVKQVCKVFRSMNMIPCTACRYCTDGCPKNILIPDLFSSYNAKKIFNNWNQDMYYDTITKNHGKASDCIRCRQCERICPQHLKITDLLIKVSEEFEKKSFFDSEKRIEALKDFILGTNDPIYIYGAGEKGKKLLEWLRKNMNDTIIEGFVVSDSQPLDQEADLIVKHISDIPESSKVIVSVSSVYCDSVRSEIEKAGIYDSFYLY